MASKAEYRRKLQDPRWQKKRLGILERDGFKCVSCTKDDETLHVHHKRYSPTEPWNIPDYCLVTLCKTCHAEETEFLNGEVRYLTDIIRERFNSDEVADLAATIEKHCDPMDWSRHYLGGDPRTWLVPKNEH